MSSLKQTENRMNRPDSQLQAIPNDRESMTARRMGSSLGQMARIAINRASQYTSGTRKYVQERPLQSIAMAAATGVLIGSAVTLLKRRK